MIEWLIARIPNIEIADETGVVVAHQFVHEFVFFDGESWQQGESTLEFVERVFGQNIPSAGPMSTEQLQACKATLTSEGWALQWQKWWDDGKLV